MVDYTIYDIRISNFQTNINDGGEYNSILRERLHPKHSAQNSRFIAFR